MSPEETLTEGHKTGEWRLMGIRDERNKIRRRVYIANPDERSWHTGCWVFWFGHSPTYVLAYGRGVEDALENAAQWISNYAPGLVVNQDDLDSRVADAREDWINKNERHPTKDRDFEEIQESAEEDLICTESGWFIGHEVGIVLNNPSPQTLKAFVFDR